jgi:hypothetical protein
MLAYVLAIAVGVGSIALYMAAFLFPELHRKNDFIWSGVGLFYALVLWVCAGRITGGVLLGQMASISLIGWLGWQMLVLRLAIARSGASETISPETQEKIQRFNPFKAKKAPKSPSVPETPQQTTETQSLAEVTPQESVTEEKIADQIPIETTPESQQPLEQIVTSTSTTEPEETTSDEDWEALETEPEVSATLDPKTSEPKIKIKEPKKGGFSLSGLLTGLFSKKQSKTPEKLSKTEKPKVSPETSPSEETTLETAVIEGKATETSQPTSEPEETTLETAVIEGKTTETSQPTSEPEETTLETAVAEEEQTFLSDETAELVTETATPETAETETTTSEKITPNLFSI